MPRYHYDLWFLLKDFLFSKYHAWTTDSIFKVVFEINAEILMIIHFFWAFSKKGKQDISARKFEDPKKKAMPLTKLLQLRAFYEMPKIKVAPTVGQTTHVSMSELHRHSSCLQESKFNMDKTCNLI